MSKHTLRWLRREKSDLERGALSALRSTPTIKASEVFTKAAQSSKNSTCETIIEVEYGRFTAVLLEAVKELSAKFEALGQRIAPLESGRGNKDRQPQNSASLRVKNLCSNKFNLGLKS